MTKNRVLQSSFQSLTSKICRFIDDSAALPACEATFNALALEVFRFQAEANPILKGLLASRGIDPQRLRDWREMPTIPLTAFKDFEVTCLLATERPVWFESSGTTGERRSRHFHSRDSLTVYERSLLPPFIAHLRPAETPVFLSLTPEAAAAPHSSLAHMLEVVSKATPFLRAVFAGAIDPKEGWVIDFETVQRLFKAAAICNQPLLLCGTAFQFVHLMDALPGPAPLPAGSRVMETGGYKGRSRELTREELHSGISAKFGIPRNHIVREYGMSELGSQAYDRVCGGPEAGFQFPPWARVRLISPETGLEASPGEAGLIQICDLANIASAIMIETADLAVASGGTFQLLGRAAFAEPKGCSLLSAA